MFFINDYIGIANICLKINTTDPQMGIDLRLNTLKPLGYKALWYQIYVSQCATQLVYLGSDWFP